MTPERWRQIDRLYQAALERDATEREAFLDKACAGDEELRREVESLLAWISTQGSRPNNVSCLTEHHAPHSKTKRRRFLPSQGIGTSVSAKPAARSKGLCARL